LVDFYLLLQIGVCAQAQAQEYHNIANNFFIIFYDNVNISSTQKVEVSFSSIDEHKFLIYKKAIMFVKSFIL
jgi:hypothetical protein